MGALFTMTPLYGLKRAARVDSQKLGLVPSNIGCR